MLPRRRYRLLLFVAAVVVLLFYRSANNSRWDHLPHSYPSQYDNEGRPPAHGSGGHAQGKADSPFYHGQGLKHDIPPGPPPPPPPPPPPAQDHLAQPAPEQKQPEKAPSVELPALKPNVGDGDFGPTNPAPPAAADPPEPATTTSRIHWRSFPEHFPVPATDIIPLPTGLPKPIPRIQFDFPAREEPAARQKRESRLAEIKSEMVRVWRGYRAYAWMHDELSPISKFYRDPFCGWAATLVDGLDTLWIMGMREEFDEAATAVGSIDFTYSPKRNDIPVFETVIRYLGGLLAAYDVSGGHSSGGKYKVLLDKAEELAEILMGAFDTPNRMPILYYQWRPESVSQPHRAATANVAELGTLSMEFTRLAQLTGKNKYYDAVARITNELEGLQERGTSLGGIFPENLDASGCNRTATNLQRQAALEAQEKGKQLPLGDMVHKPDWSGTGVRDSSFSPPSAGGGDTADAPKIQKRGFRELNARDGENTPLTSSDDFMNPWSQASLIDLDCVKQPVVPAGTYESYSMGGSQDSVYEYFPKQYLLLGGLEPKYRTMHERVIEGNKKWLLFRPMIKDPSRNILFASKLTTNGEPHVDANRVFEVTHLTCFLGGMFGLGAKIFNSAEDLDIAKKLTDGCVWAYESTPSGIMPEGATVVPCGFYGSRNAERGCPFNETAWYQWLDPQWEYRDQQIVDYYERARQQEEYAAQVEREKEIEELRARQGQQGQQQPGGQETQGRQPGQDEDESVPGWVFGGQDTPPAAGGGQAPAHAPPPGPAAPHLDEPTYRYPRPEPRDEDTSGGLAKRGLEKRAPPVNRAGANFVAGSGSEWPSREDDPNRPFTHLEYVQSRIENEKIPPGYVRFMSRRYILRPEAIESVWYMYRITGDPEWMEKGWRMWQSVIEAVRTDVGHSALLDVLDEKPQQTDEMESFWIAETLKYFYLLFATPDTISLDEWVLNTEAHPFRRPT